MYDIGFPVSMYLFVNVFYTYLKYCFRYLEEEDGNVDRAYNETVIDEETLSDDEKTLARMDDFDRQYRFR